MKLTKNCYKIIKFQIYYCKINLFWMDFLDSLDLHTTDEKSNRVRSWYLYEQYKSLEKNQLDAAKKLKHRSYQDRILHRELSERRARRQFSEQFNVRHSESPIEKTIKSDPSRTPYSESTYSFIESVCDQEEIINEKEQDNFSQHSKTSKLYDEFKSSDDKINNSCSESVNSIIENTVNENVANDIKDELEFVKKNIAEIINMQIETEKECLEKYTEHCDVKHSNNETINSSKKFDVKSSTAADKYYPKYDNRILAIWSKLVAFSYNVMQMNRGNCYYDYSSQFLTGVLAFDVLRRGINRMCHILQPYVCPIKFAIDEYDASYLNNFNQSRKYVNSIKSDKIEQKYCPLHARKYYEKRCRLIERKYNSEEKWQSRCKYSLENKINEMRTYGASEPWRSTAKFSGSKNSFKEKFSHKTLAEKSQTDRLQSYCKCRQFKKAINPIIKLSQYVNMILQEIED